MGPEGGRQARGRAGPRDGEVQGHLRRARPDLRRDVRILKLSFPLLLYKPEIHSHLYINHYSLQWHNKFRQKAVHIAGHSLVSEKKVYTQFNLKLSRESFKTFCAQSVCLDDILMYYYVQIFLRSVPFYDLQHT